MPIDREKALGADLGTTRRSYEPDDVILYHLGVGAGFDATSPGELQYTFEKNLKVLPSFAVVADTTFSGRARQTGESEDEVAFWNAPGLEFNPALMLHGEQEIELHRPLPAPRTDLRGDGPRSRRHVRAAAGPSDRADPWRRRAARA